MKPRIRSIQIHSLTVIRLLVTAGALQAGSSAFADDGTWTNDGFSIWSTPGNWSGGIVADGSGFTANFNTIDITADRTVSLDSDRTLTTLVFGDTDTATTPAGWLLDNNGNASNNLILAGTTPTITVNALGAGKSAAISAIIEGTAGLTKTGAGALVLSGDNTFTGNVTNTVAGGITITHSNALGSGTKTVVMNSASVATLRLDGSLGDLSIPAGISLQTAGTQAGGSVINVAGNNTINGNVTLNSGATGTAFSSASGILTLGGTVKIVGGSVRPLFLRGDSNGEITGVISNGGASLPVNKDTGAGTWKLSGANTYNGNTTVSSGTLKAGVASTTAPDSGPFGVNSSVTVNASGTLDITGFDTRINALIGTGAVTLGSANLTIGTANANSTFDGVISGTGGTLTKVGTGLQTMGGSSDFSGGTTITNGDIVLTNESALGSGTLTIANTASQIDCFGIANGIDFANDIDIDLSTHRAGISARTSGDNTLSGAITISGSGPNNTVVVANDVESSTMTVNGAISSGTSGATLSFRGSGAGSSGLVTNTVSLPTDAFMDVNGTTNWTFSGSGSTWGVTGLYGSANIALGSHNALSTTAVTGSGAGTGAIDLAGFDQTVGGLTGPVQRIIGNSSTTADSILTINSASPQTFEGAIDDVLGSGTRQISLVLNGGEQTLSGTSSYTGPTTLNAGTLTITGALGTTAVEVKNTAKLAGNGLLDGTVTVRSGGHLALDVADAPGNQTALLVSGALTLDAGNVFDLSAAAPPAVGGPYVLLTASGGITGTPGTITLNGLAGSLAVSGNNLELTVSASGFTTWIAGYSVGGENQPGDDPDNDGISNLVEYALAGFDPGVANAAPGVVSGNLLSYNKRQPLATDISYTIEESTDLGISDPWAAVTPDVNDGTTISYLLPGGPPENFLRLKVLKP